LPILTVPGVNAVVGFGKHITPIDGSQLVAIRTLLKSGRPCELVPFVAVGKRVRVESGPLGGAEGFVTAGEDGSRFVVSITALGRSVSVAISDESLKALPGWSDVRKLQNRQMLVS
jgi:transcription antitermination factor NusG